MPDSPFCSQFSRTPKGDHCIVANIIGYTNLVSDFDADNCKKCPTPTFDICPNSCTVGTSSTARGWGRAGTTSTCAGYTNNVVRPGNQISRNINPTQSVSYVGEPPAKLRGAAEPGFRFNSSSFWAQGVNIGLSLRSRACAARKQPPIIPPRRSAVSPTIHWRSAPDRGAPLVEMDSPRAVRGRRGR